MEALSDVVLDWQLECDVRSDCTLQTRHVTNSAEGLWRERVEERWQRTRELGRGSFGVVWLEKCASGPSSGQLRAVKELRKTQTSARPKYYSKELEAIVKFSHKRVRIVPRRWRITFYENPADKIEVPRLLCPIFRVV